MTQKDRLVVFNKYNGKCAYCGTLLQKGWHIDHFEPLRRGLTRNEKPMHKDRDNIQNMMPSCASCNINKHSQSIEEFRSLIKGFMKHLNTISTQYKIAKRYGLITETDIEVKFYYETLEHDNIIGENQRLII